MACHLDGMLLLPAFPSPPGHFSGKLPLQESDGMEGKGEGEVPVPSRAGNGSLNMSRKGIKGYIDKIEYDGEVDAVILTVTVYKRKKQLFRPRREDFVTEEDYQKELRNYEQHLKEIKETNRTIEHLHIGEVFLSQEAIQ